MNIRYICLLLSLSIFSAPALSKVAPKNTTSYLIRAQKEFGDGKYDVAAKWYRRYLRTNRKDGDAWSQLAVCFYYSGEADKALQYLKKWEPYSKTKSYNQYHQGLILVSQGQNEAARTPLAKAARFIDDYAARAVYELVALEYNDNDPVKTMYWVNLYKQRFAQGAYIQQVLRVEQSLTNRVPISDVRGNKKPDQEKALYKFHPYSLAPIPHFWFARLGYLYNAGDTVQPDLTSKTGTKVENFSKHDLVVHLGLGLGPVIQNDLTSYFGYNYKQDWYSEDERLSGYLPPEEFTDLFVYLPFRPDLLVRTHRLYGDFDYKLPYNFSVGTLVFQEYSFMGSTLVPGPEGDEVDQKSRYIGEANLLQPYVSYKYADRYEAKFMLYMYKEIIEDAEEFSNKTYNVLGGGDFVMSYALSNRFMIPSYKLNFNLELFQLEFIYNDYWLDFTRLGGVIGADYELEQGFIANLAVGYYDDTYQLAVLRQGECNFRSKEGAESEGPEPTSCPHKDTGMVYQGGVSYDLSQFTRAMFSFTMIKNENPDLIIYEKNENIFKVSVTMAFPSFNKVSRFVDRYADFAFRKEQE